VLCCTSAHFTDPSGWHGRAVAVARGGTGPLAAGIVERWFTPRWAQEHPAEVERAVRWVGGTSDEGYRACCQAIAAWDHRARLPEIPAPTLVLAGAHDVATPVVPHARLLADTIPDARLEVLDAAHVATVEAPRAATELIRSHVAG
jgi:3-oxoadipate enol-lactonase